MPGSTSLEVLLESLPLAALPVPVPHLPVVLPVLGLWVELPVPVPHLPVVLPVPLPEVVLAEVHSQGALPVPLPEVVSAEVHLQGALVGSSPLPVVLQWPAVRSSVRQFRLRARRSSKSRVLVVPLARTRAVTLAPA